jgi:hypothetical protein
MKSWLFKEIFDLYNIMVSLIYINIGPIQDYIYDSIYQTLTIHNDTNLQIYIGIHNKYISEFRNELTMWNIFTNNVVLVDIDLSPQFDFLREQHHGFRENFWLNTTKRFFYIEYIIKLYQIENVYHLENDVMLFQPLKVLDNDKLTVVSDHPTRVIASIMFIKNLKQISDLNNYIKSTISNTTQFMNDMELLGNYRDVSHFNIDPNIGDTYDAACFGQYLGGVDYRNISEFDTKPIGEQLLIKYTNGLKGFINETSIIKPNNYTIAKKNNRYYANENLLINLHIHSKQLYNFSSNKIEFDDIITGDRVLGWCDIVFLTRDIMDFHKNIEHFTQGKQIILIENKELDDNSQRALSKILDTYSKDVPVKIFIYTHILDIFIKHILPLINIKCIIYCGNSDHTFDEQYLTLLNDCDVIKVIAQNPNVIHNKLELLPIGIANSMWRHGDLLKLYSVIKDTYRYKKSGIYININPDTFFYRKLLLDGIKLSSKLMVSTNKEYQKYLHELSQCKYALCPRGNGLDCHRFWECIYLNVIPVVINNNYTNSKAFTKHLHSYGKPFYEINSNNINDIVSELEKLL